LRADNQDKILVCVHVRMLMGFLSAGGFKVRCQKRIVRSPQATVHSVSCRYRPSRRCHVQMADIENIFWDGFVDLRSFGAASCSTLPETLTNLLSCCTGISRLSLYLEHKQVRSLCFRGCCLRRVAICYNMHTTPCVRSLGILNNQKVHRHAFFLYGATQGIETPFPRLNDLQ
jgi:hypothetical protein